jgi:hypothetical protein
MDFIYDEKRICKQTLLFIKCVTLLFHFFCIYINFDSIEKDNRFIYYSFTLFSTLLCVCNNARYEYAHFKIYGNHFASIYEFKQWKKKHQYICLTSFLTIFEITVHIFFFCMTITKLSFENRKLLFYSISSLILEIYAILCFFITIFVLIFCCSLHIPIIDWFFLDNQTEQPRIRTNILLTQVYIDKEMECCICMDKNINNWIKIPCGHAFHHECIRHWLRTSNTCPVCRSSNVNIN